VRWTVTGKPAVRAETGPGDLVPGRILQRPLTLCFCGQARGPAEAARTSRTYVYVEQLCFQAGNALVEEVVVGPGGLEAFFQGAAAGGKVAEPLLEGGILGGKPLDGVGVVVALGVAELAEQLADAGALGADLGMGGLERLLGIKCPLLPGRLGLGASGQRRPAVADRWRG
jgi:hypothetical protein